GGHLPGRLRSEARHAVTPPRRAGRPSRLALTWSRPPAHNKPVDSTSSLMSTTVGAFEAKTHLSALLDRVEQGEVIVDGHCRADLTAIRTPLVIFSSHGDNITPPHQALAWLRTVYRSTEELVAARQR
ncbi:DUF3141 domain-containing protein, partial [Escherichia coli]|nr:DUF3141 domain-containing protein [Escherichia coli]